MDMRRLRYFLAVADTGHITRAAAQLGLQQPPLSQQIKALEAELGLVLFQRHPKGVTLTDAGRLLQDEARRLLQDMAAMQARLKQVAQGQQGRLALGFTSSVAAHAYMPRALRACRQQHPHISLSLTEANAAEITEAVLAERLHCGFLRVPIARPEGLVFETLFHETAVVALPIDHPLAPLPGELPRTLSVTDLRAEGFILVRQPGAPGLYANLLALCEAQGFSPRVVAEVPRMMSNLNLVAAGAGISVVPASMQGAHPHAVAYCPLADATPLDAPMTLVWRQSDQAGPTATFVALARHMAREVDGGA
ncbi:MAG: LysR family transcriptional regulator [Burkholderiales bacterium RIFCSPHIGHO2_12_FULL_69_20]|nr:MAG: LysR family transcriptional regulator [Burkholderiales bacterium RIFCSPHIGHO2_12_FULL_69_20]